MPLNPLFRAAHTYGAWVHEPETICEFQHLMRWGPTSAILSLGHGNASSLRARSPRVAFDDTCRVE